MNDPSRDRLFKAAKSHFQGQGREYRRSGLSMEVYMMCLSLAEVDKHKKGLIDMSVADIARAISVPSKRVDDILRRESMKENGIIARAPARKSTDPIRYRINLEALAKSDADYRQTQTKLEQAKERYQSMVADRQNSLAAKRQARRQNGTLMI